MVGLFDQFYFFKTGMVMRKDDGINYDVLQDDDDLALIFHSTVKLAGSAIRVLENGRLALQYADGEKVMLAPCSKESFDRVVESESVLCASISANTSAKPDAMILPVLL